MKIIILTSGYKTKVDDKWFSYLNQWRWHTHLNSIGKPYAIRRPWLKGGGKTGKTIYMHRIINNTPDGFETDHKDRDTLNNQENNLRTVTRLQNAHNLNLVKTNKSGIKNVCWDKQSNKWEVYLKNNKKRIYRKKFKDLQVAFLASKWARKLYYGN